MSRILLLCFIHGFKGTDNTFHEFPQDLERLVAKELPEHKVQSIIYPKYETKGELAEATEAFVDWLKEQVIECRKKNLENPWPPNDREVGVVLVAHSMGGFVAADALFLSLKDKQSNPDPDPSKNIIFPPIQGILTFDTPYNGLARSMFVYGAFSNYQKVSSVFNAMTALSAAAPVSLGGLSRLTGNRNTSSAAAASASSAAASSSTVSAASSTAWQLIAVKTGTVGAIAAGGVAAYIHREAIMNGMRNIKNINKDSVVDGYNQSVGALGQGLAYINRGNVGTSFAWLSDHFTFIGSLMKQRELATRLERLAALKGVGVHDFYCSLGENGYWSGGYFVPERTFCAVPEGDHPAAGIFERRVMQQAGDEVKAHLSLFRPEKHRGYEGMTEKAAGLVKEWFLSEEPVVDGYKPEEEKEEGKALEEEKKKVDEVIEEAEKVEESGEKEAEAGTGEEKKKADDADTDKKEEGESNSLLPDESPIDIAAAAALVPLPGSEDNLVADAGLENADTEEKRTYLQHLFQLSQQAGSGMKDWWPSKVPDMSSLPKAPSMPKVQMPSAVSSLSQSGMNLFKRKDGHTPAEEDAPAEKAAAPSSEKTAEGSEVLSKSEAETKDVAAPADAEDTKMTEAPQLDDKAPAASSEAAEGNPEKKQRTN